MKSLRPALLVTSGKGGTGKSLISANVAYHMSKIGRVALIDGDIRAPNLSYIMGVPNQKLEVDDNRNIIPYRISDNLEMFSMDHFFSRDNGVKRAIILPGEEIRSIVNQSIYGVSWHNPHAYVIDSDPSTSDVLIALSRIFRDKLYALVVTTNDISSIFDSQRTIDALIINNINIIGILGNMIFDGEDDRIRDTAKKFHINYLGYIPFNNDIRKANNEGHALIPDDGLSNLIKEVSEYSWRKMGA